MNRNKKIASVFNKSKSLIVWREDENYYWVTDKFTMIRLYKDDYQEFKTKWCNYKNNIIYGELEVGEKINIKEGEILDKAPNFDLILEKFNNNVELENTDLRIKGKHNIYYTVNKSKLVVIDNKYDQLLPDYYKRVTNEKDKYTKTLVLNGQSEVVGVIMPIRYDYESKYTSKSKDYNLEEDINNIYSTLQALKENKFSENKAV